MSKNSLVTGDGFAIDISQNFKLKSTGMEIKGEPSFEAWLVAGENLRYIQGAVHWWIGDWLNYGERAYGEKYSQALDETEYSYQTLRDDAWVAGKIEMSRRRDNLSWSHHQEVASLEPDEQDRVLDEAEEKGLSKRQLRAVVRDIRRIEPAEPRLGKYRVIYADPPWEYSNSGNNENYGHAERHYPTMAINDICMLKIGERSVFEIAEANAVLFLWATSPLLNKAFKVMESWGFEYKASFVWDKVKHNYGHYNSVRHEMLLIGVTGSCQPDERKLYDSVQSIEKTEQHSEKPKEFRRIIDELYPIGNRIELFGRKRVDGWEVWGDEL